MKVTARIKITDCDPNNDGLEPLDVRYTGDDLSWAIARCIMAVDHPRMDLLIAKIVDHLVAFEMMESVLGTECNTFVDAALRLVDAYKKHDKEANYRSFC